MKKYSDSCYCISPIDGRYRDKTNEFRKIFSEFGLMKARVIVEIEYLIFLISFLSKNRALNVKPFNETNKEKLRSVYKNFNIFSYVAIKIKESVVNHDVEAVKLFLKAKLKRLGLKQYCTFVHLGRTSEDINNLAYAMQLSNGVGVLLCHYSRMYEEIDNRANSGKDVPMLASTHGQPATGSTIGWTYNVYGTRLGQLILDLEYYKKISVKFGGATGGNNAMFVAYPGLDWRGFNESFVNQLESINLVNDFEPKIGFCINHFTFQIEPHDTYKKLFDIITSLNLVLLDFSQNMWNYISMEYFIQKPKKSEVGSSAMPQKINPIDFENAEGNLVVANALFNSFSGYLPLSRGYRHLSDSTIIRNFGVAFSHTLISLKSLGKGIGKIEVNESFLKKKLDGHPEIISEGIQTILRANGVEEAYEIIKDGVRGKEVTLEMLYGLVFEIAEKYHLAEDVVKSILSLTPSNYLGDREF